ncbi:PZRN4 protein, partial [Acromyrmex charruanus]
MTLISFTIKVNIEVDKKSFGEVTLRKSGSAEKLGLTVCYSSGSGSEDLDTEVYISEIVPESLAARDGRLREGDQILQDLSAEQLQYILKVEFLRLYGDYIDYVWDKLPEHMTDSEVQTCDKHYNQP